MGEITVTCPSGVVGRIRGFKMREANLMKDRAAVKSGTAFESLLSNCWIETVNGGPYAWLAPKADGSFPRIDWAKMLVCDRFWALMKIREATYGPLYDFKVKCQDADCGQTIEWELNLNDLPVKELPKTSREVLLEGENSFETTLPDGKKCYFKLQTGHGEREIMKAAKHKDRSMTAMLNARIISIEGLSTLAERLDYIDNLDLGDVYELGKLFDEADGGVETSIEIECTACGMEQSIELPLGGEFFSPPKKRKTTTSG